MYGDLAVAKNYSTNIVPWMKAREALAALPEGATGPTTEGKQYIESALWALAPQVAKWANVAPDQIRDYGTLKKYLAQAANTLGGNGTDLRLVQTISGNPNLQMNDLTNRQLINFGIAVQRMGTAQSLEASRAQPNAPVGSNPVGYSGKAGTLGPTMDPRAFEVDLLPPDQRKKLIDSIKSPAERAKFNYSYHIGLKNQLFSAPGQ
jgi:hypothetical protein